MKKRLTRYGRVIVAEVFEVKQYPSIHLEGKTFESIVDKREFNDFLGGVLFFEPTQKTYDNANKWADEVIDLHKRNTEK